MSSAWSLLRYALSPPARGRGLKLAVEWPYASSPSVAPRAGAWIETAGTVPPGPMVTVAPRAGAWIETLETEYLIR